MILAVVSHDAIIGSLHSVLRYLQPGRITPHETYLQSLQKENVSLVTDKIDHIAENGVVTKDGVLHECEVLVTATGFDTSFVPRAKIVGLDGVTIQKYWVGAV